MSERQRSAGHPREWKADHLVIWRLIELGRLPESRLRLLRSWAPPRIANGAALELARREELAR